MTTTNSHNAGISGPWLVDRVTTFGGTSMSTMIKVQLSDENGHTELMMSPAETAEVIQENSVGAWIFADNAMVNADQLDEANLSTVSSVRIVPSFVGGC